MPGYVYRGTGEEVILTRRGRKPKTDPFDPTRCGTTQGVSQHRRFKEPLCLKCGDWYNAQRRERRREKQGGGVSEDTRHET